MSPIYLFLSLGSSIYIYFFLITEVFRAEIKPTNSLVVCPPAPDRPGCAQWKLARCSLYLAEPPYHSTTLVSVLILISSDTAPSDLVYSIKKC